MSVFPNDGPSVPEYAAGFGMAAASTEVRKQAGSKVLGFADINEPFRDV
jgi:hypothetical protein